MYFEGQDYVCGERIVNLNLNIFIDANVFGRNFPGSEGLLPRAKLCEVQKAYCSSWFSSEGTGT